MEFEVEAGRNALRRRYAFSTFDSDRFIWILVFAVEGMGGAVALRLQIENHRSEAEAYRTHGSAQLFAGTIVPVGLAAHAYRPWGGPEPSESEQSDCRVLHGGKCYPRELDDIGLSATTTLVGQFCQPGGEALLYARLEELYLQEFCPPNELRRVEALQAAVTALERSGDPPSLTDSTPTP